MKSRRFWIGQLARTWPGLAVAAVLLGFLVYASYLTFRLPADQRAVPFATIATGATLFAVAFLTYLLERRSYAASTYLLKRASQCALDEARRPPRQTLRGLTQLGTSHEPSLGILPRHGHVYRNTEVAIGDGEEVYAEFTMWNAGDVPILVLYPSPVLVKELQQSEPFTGRVEVERIQQGQAVIERAFPIVLGKGETCIWRQFTGDRGSRPIMHSTVRKSRDRAVQDLQGQNVSRQFLYQLSYYAKPTHEAIASDVKDLYVGFSYRIENW